MVVHQSRMVDLTGTDDCVRVQMALRQTEEDGVRSAPVIELDAQGRLSPESSRC